MKQVSYTVCNLSWKLDKCLISVRCLPLNYSYELLIYCEKNEMNCVCCNNYEAGVLYSLQSFLET